MLRGIKKTLDDLTIVEQYNGGFTTVELGELHDVSSQTICERLKEHGVDRRKQVGPTNTNWRGGYKDYYGPTWKAANRAARKRDNDHCSRCGKTRDENGKGMQVHHILPFRCFGVEHHIEANTLSNLVCLCTVCHPITDRFVHSLLEALLGLSPVFRRTVYVLFAYLAKHKQVRIPLIEALQWLGCEVREKWSPPVVYIE